MTTHKKDYSPNSDGLETRGLTINEEAQAIVDQMNKLHQESNAPDSAKEGWESRLEDFISINEMYIRGFPVWKLAAFMEIELSTARADEADKCSEHTVKAREEGRREGIEEALSKIQTERRRYPNNQDYGLAKLALKNVEDALTNLIK